MSPCRLQLDSQRRKKSSTTHQTDSWQTSRDELREAHLPTGDFGGPEIQGLPQMFVVLVVLFVVDSLFSDR